MSLHYYFSLLLLCTITVNLYSQSPDLVPKWKSTNFTFDVYGYVDAEGKRVIPFQYAAAHYFSEGLAAVKMGVSYGFINKKNETIIPFEYDYAWGFDQGLAAVKKQAHFGFIDTTGNAIVPIVYDAIDKLSKDRAMLSPKTLAAPYTYYEAQPANLATNSPQFINYHFFFEGLCRVEKKGKCGFVNKVGKVVLPLKYDHVWNFSEGLAGVQLDGEAGFINKKGKKKIPFKYDYVWSFQNGLARVEQDKKIGFIDKSGRVVIPFLYDYASPSHHGYITVKKYGKYGLIDQSGKQLLDATYDFLQPIATNSILYRQGKYFGLLHPNGNSIAAAKYTSVQFIENTDLLLVKKQNKYGILDKNGKVILDCKYTEINIIKNHVNYFLVKQDKNYGIVNQKGEIIRPYIYGSYRLTDGGWLMLYRAKGTHIFHLKNGQLHQLESQGGIFVNHHLVRLESTNQKQQLFDIQTGKVLPHTYQYIDFFSEGYAMVAENNRRGYINAKSELMLPMQYVNTTKFRAGHAMVQTSKFNWTIIDTLGNTIQRLDSYNDNDITPLSYDTWLVRSKDNSRAGIIDHQGNELLPPIYHFKNLHGEFSENILEVVDSTGKMGAVDKRGNWIVPCQYEGLWTSNKSYNIVSNNNKVGLVNKKGQVIIPLEYEEVHYLSADILLAKNNNLYGLFNTNGEALTPLIYNQISKPKAGLFEVRKAGRFGLINRYGQEVIPCQFDQITTYFEKGIAIVSRPPQGDHLTYGLISQEGDWILNYKYHKIEPFDSSGLTKVRLHSKIGLINWSGKEVVAPIYHSIASFQNGLAKVSKSNPTTTNQQLYGYINQKGEEVIPCVYTSIKPYKKGLFLITKDNKQTIINQNDVPQIAWYDQITPFDGYSNAKLLVVQLGNRVGIIDSSLNIITPIEYDYISTNNTNFIKVSKEDKDGYLDSQGKVVIPAVYDKIDEKYNSAFLKVTKDNKVGLIDKRGQVIIPLLYDDVGYFFSEEQQQTWVERNGKMGMVNRAGKVIIPCIYDRLHWIHSMPTIIAVEDGQYGLIDYYSHQIVLPTNYDFIQSFYTAGDTLLRVVKDHKIGLFSLDAKIIIPLEYDKITVSTPSVFRVEKGGTYSFMNVKDREVLTPFYEQLTPINSSIYIAKQGKKYGIVSNGGNELLAASYDSIYNSWGRIIVQNNTKMGLVDIDWAAQKSNWALECQYDSIFNLYYQKVGVLKGAKQALLLAQGGTTPFIYDQIMPLDAKLLKVRQGERWGIITDSNKIILPIKYEQISPIQYLPQYYVIQQNKKYGLINSKGQIVIPTNNHSLRYFWTNFLIAQKQGKYGLYNFNGKLHLPFVYDQIKTNQLQYDWLIVTQDNKYGVVTYDNKIIVPIEYDTIRPLMSHLLEVRKGDKYGYVNHEGATITPIIYEKAGQFGKDLILTVKDGKYGYLNTLGEVVIPFIYVDATPFGNNGTAKVQNEQGAWFFIGRTGQTYLLND